MASITASNAVHAALTPTVVDVVTLTPGTPSRIEIRNRDASTPLYFRYDGTDPVVGAKESYVVQPGDQATFMPTTFPVEIRIVSIAGLSYSVQALPS